MDTNKIDDLNSDTQIPNSFNSSMEEEVKYDSANESLSEINTSRKNTSTRIRHKRREYSPEVPNTPIYKRLGVPKEIFQSKEKTEEDNTKDTGTPRLLIKSRSKNSVKRFSPTPEPSGTVSQANDQEKLLEEPGREVIFLSHLGNILREKFCFVEDFSLDFRKLGIKIVTETEGGEGSQELQINIPSSSEKSSISPLTPQLNSSGKSSTASQRKGPAVKLKLPRMHSVEKAVKLENECSVSPASHADDEHNGDLSSNVSEFTEELGSSDGQSRPKRLAAGKGRDFISQLVGPSRRHSRSVEEEEKDCISDKESLYDNKKNKEMTEKMLREAEVVAETLAEMASRPRRSLVPSSKMRDAISQKLSAKHDIHTQKEYKISARPNSALDIVRNAKLYQRVRSPSPEVPRVSPVPLTSEDNQNASEERNGKVLDVSVKSEEDGQTKIKEETSTERPSDQLKTESELNLAESSTGLLMIAPVDILKSDMLEAEEPKEQEVPSTIETQQVKPGRSKGKLLNENDSPVKMVTELEVSTRKPKAVEPVRSSRRIIKPVRFEDFVTDSPVMKHETASSSAVPVIVDAPSSSEETPAASSSAKATGRSRSKSLGGNSRRKSNNDQVQPIRLKLRLDGKRSSIIGTSVTTPVPEAPAVSESVSFLEEPIMAPESSEELLSPIISPFMSPSSADEKRRQEAKLRKRSSKSWVYGYTPSVKPVLEDLVHTDGSVEKIGVVVYAVMDRLLLEVCQDGVARHSGAISKKDKRQRAMGIAKQRYLEKKAEYEVLKADYLARGEVPPVFSHTLTANKRYSRTPATSELETVTSGRAERSKKGGLYKQNEYLMKSATRTRKASDSDEYESKETKTRKALNYLSMQFQREMNQALEEEKCQTDRKKRRHDGYSASRNENEYYTQERGFDSKDRIREKTVPFSTFLQNKPQALSKSLGLVTPSDATHSHDFFYRDLLYHTESELGNGSTDDSVDVMEDDQSVNPISVSVNADAQSLASLIGNMLMRPCLVDGSYGVSDFYDRIREQTELRKAIINQVMDIITEQYVSEEVAMGSNASVNVFNSTLRNATLLRDAFNMFSEERQESVFWAHKVLIETLPIHFLASYLILLRYCKTLTNSYIGKIIKNCSTESYPWPEVVEMLTDFTNVKVVDPDLELLNRTVATNSLSDVVFLLVSPALTAGDFALKARYHENVFRWLKQMGHADSEVMRMNFSDDYDDCSIAQICDTMIDKIVQKIKQLTKSHRDKRIVLVGWQTTCFFNHRAVQLTHGVSAIIDLAFPVLTTEGPRGTADDDILLTYCPSLFICGSEAEDFEPVAMKELRCHMLVPSGLIVVAHADSNLLVSNTVLNNMCITQKTVHRALVEQISQFLSLHETRKERSQLIPVELNNVYNVDPSKFSAKDKHKIASEKEETTRAKKKRFTGPFSPPPVAMPALSAEMNVSTSQARNRFDQMLKKSMPPYLENRKREDALRKENFREPRVPSGSGYKSSPLPSPSVRPSSAESSSNLLDPALISLS